MNIYALKQPCPKIVLHQCEFCYYKSLNYWDEEYHSIDTTNFPDKCIDDKCGSILSETWCPSCVRYGNLGMQISHVNEFEEVATIEE